jgi:SAM-dependent methyltransferase/uncharacterized protein YbaR (Trm112 family)
MGPTAIRPNLRIDDEQALNMSAEFRSLLVCPGCSGSLRWSSFDCRCDNCNASYRVNDGVARLVLPAVDQEAKNNESERNRLNEQVKRKQWLARIVALVRPPLPYDTHGRHCGQQTFDRSIPRQSDHPSFVLNLGAGNKGDSQLIGLSAETRASLIHTDISPGQGIDFLSDAHRIPLPDSSLDGVVFQGVVEHISRPWIAAAEIVRVLKPGGVVFCEAPFMQWFHEDPKDYYRFTEDGLKALFDPCEPVESGVAIGPVGGVVGVSRELLPILFDNAYLYWIVKWAIGWVTLPAVLLDRLYRGRPRAKNVALAVYLVARKK